MSYQIEITYSNGYRCGCCSHDWEYNEEAETLEDALAFVPIELVDGEPLQFNGDMEVTKVEVTKDGEDIAWAHAWWSTGYGRGSGYTYTKWSGYRPDTERFSVVYSGRKKVDLTWEEALAKLKTRRDEAERRKAEQDLKDAQKRLNYYSQT